MTRLLFTLILLAPTPTQGSHISIPDAIQAAYDMGLEDAMYSADDIGMERITIDDIEGMI